MPGHIGTSIAINTGKVLGKGEAMEMPAKDVARLRDLLVKRGFPVADVDDDQIRGMIQQIGIIFRDNAPTTAAQAATIILDGVRNDEWRILVGEDAQGARPHGARIAGDGLRASRSCRPCRRKAICAWVASEPRRAEPATPRRAAAIGAIRLASRSRGQLLRAGGPPAVPDGFEESSCARRGWCRASRCAIPASLGEGSNGR